MGNSDEMKVVDSFPTMEEARRFADKAQQNDPTNLHEYLVTPDPDSLRVSEEDGE